VFRHTIESNDQHEDAGKAGAGQENDRRGKNTGTRQPSASSRENQAGSTFGGGKAVASEHTKDGKASAAGYIFQDESTNTFFRRLAFSPEGSFVVAPAATLGPLASTSE
jgi:hypothetical protein